MEAILGGGMLRSWPRWLQSKALWFVVCLYPLARATYLVLAGDLVNPIEFITRSSGTWTLVFLLLSLAITPLRRITGWSGWQQYRRMLGLYAFFYVVLHLTTYIWLDQFFDWGAIWRDVVKRPFITVGFAAFVLLIPLAITSTNAMMRKLKRRWGLLHQLVYPIAILGVTHYWWLVKKDLTQAMIYAAILFVLLTWRLVKRFGAAKS
ncbi:sulfoxide reductase heme-binding subunit YedZ [Chitinibacter bivalviorum]|uniref:Protein-methionine-sulfoxide reductase heme-binding subunit MsrQ n=1 Tax=Chitinibacter bivalviorum TaxID=2739434 RepID=A0A7H9BJ01_9NEIS|nr:protein-methionine-sulfoxide reductase heme-binding subunit MsrQ [Chitinibacter bivalviorum]QLG88459.1 sulfoxide reductase heme-binding subunit YedZ [Chitinibacter bivalviorum]